MGRGDRPGARGGPGGAAKAISSVAFGPDGQALVAGSHDGLVWRWRLGGARRGPPQALAQQAGDRSAVWDVAFSPDGLHLAQAEPTAGWRCGAAARRPFS